LADEDAHNKDYKNRLEKVNFTDNCLIFEKVSEFLQQLNFNIKE